jgi:trans-aconitate 2-methyltransferase
VTRDWDAAAYSHVAIPQEAWARELLERLPLRGDETVLDAGCGSGRVTSLLIERLPEGRVVAVDASPSMVEGVRGVLRPGDRALVADLAELELGHRVDAVFSNAVFHWIPDHERLFRALHRALRPGGRLVAQCGGQGNLEHFHAAAHAVAGEEPFAPFFDGWAGPWNLASPEAAAERLRAAGFVDVECWLEDRQVRPEEPREYLRVGCLGPHLELLPEELGGRYLERVVDAVAVRGALRLDYVRLNIAARRPG